jgi:L-fuculose-phosphate aldolase
MLMFDSLTEYELAKKIIATVRAVVDQGLVQGTAGNVSARIPGTRSMIITPGSFDYNDMTIGDLVKVDIDTLEVVRGFRPPSSETAMHAAIYRKREDVGGVVHTHSPYATAWSTTRKPLPAIHYVISSIGYEVPVTPFFIYGTPELAEAASDRLISANATLLQNHGVIAAGNTLDNALKNAVRVEFLATVMVHSSTMGEPNILTDDQIEGTRERSALKTPRSSISQVGH